MNSTRPIDQRLTRAREDLDQQGFCLIENVLDPPAVTTIQNRILDQARAERSHGLDYEYQAEAEGDAINQWVYALTNKGAAIRELPVHPVASALAQHVLGRDYLLSSMDAHITWPGNQEMPLHADQWWMPPPVMPGETYVRQGDIQRKNAQTGGPEPADHPINAPLVLNVMWMITDFTASNGGTRLVPRSHLSGNSPAAGERYDEVIAEGPAGSIIAWDGRTWHGSGLNTSDGPRVGLTTYFCGPMMRTLHNGVYGLRTEVKESLSQEYLTLLGFTPWSSYGMTDDPACAVAKPGDETAGEMAS